MAECIEIAVVTQGQTIDETVVNLTEAVALHLAGEAPATFGLRERPTLASRSKPIPPMPKLPR